MFIIRQKTQFKENQNAESLPCKSFCFYSCLYSHVRLGPSAGMTVTHQYSDCSLSGQFGSPVFFLGEDLYSSSLQHVFYSKNFVLSIEPSTVSVLHALRKA